MSRRLRIGSAPAWCRLTPIIEAIRTHVMRAKRIHADDTTVPVLAKMKAVVGRIWTYARSSARGSRTPERPRRSPRKATRTAQARLAAMLRRKSTSKGGRSSVTSFMKLSPTTKNAVAASMAAMPLRSELLSMDPVYINVQGAKNMAMDTIADDGLCRTAGRGMRATFTMRASASSLRPLWP
jgi:hypothetical protein